MHGSKGLYTDADDHPWDNLELETNVGERGAALLRACWNWRSASKTAYGRERSLLALASIEGQSYQQAAETLDIPIKAKVWPHLFELRVGQ